MAPTPPPAAGRTRSKRRAPNPRAIARGVEVLNGIQARREAKRNNNPPTTDDTDDDGDSPSPVLDSFVHTRGPSVLPELTNFSLSEFNQLWSDLQTTIDQNYNVGSGRKSDVTGRDMLFMTLTSLKHCGSWDVVSALFDDTSASFSKRVNSFLKTLHPFLVGRYIDAVADKYTMEHLETNKRRFANYPCALYAVDVTFQKTNIPAGSFPERKRFFSKKHGQHGVKVEASVLPNGLAINVTNAVPASMADIAIAQSNREFHLNKLAKTPSELDMADQGPLREEYPASWAILADKGYQGLHRNLRAITPTKRPAGGVLTVSEMDVNDKIASDRVIIEIFFGRLKTLWSVVGDTFKWKRDNYDIYFQSCVAFTNVHIRFMPLRAEDGHDLHRLVNGLISTGQKKKAKRAGSVAMSRDKRKRRLSAMYANGETFQLSAEMEYDESEDGSCIFD